jgi:hypothetical protein
MNTKNAQVWREEHSNQHGVKTVIITEGQLLPYVLTDLYTGTITYCVNLDQAQRIAQALNAHTYANLDWGN